ncbi:MAG: hypothetical protein EPN61_03560 [Burkholderiaceae bacterium]|nr:MAG: hypothetical protein EPN61_03560 [Burkholderiaceae bacterium]
MCGKSGSAKAPAPQLPCAGRFSSRRGRCASPAGWGLARLSGVWAPRCSCAGLGRWP